MRTTPKYFLILAVMAGAAVVSASCASDGPSTAPVSQDARITQTKLQDLHAKYDWIGTYHTDGLAYVYTQLAKGSGKPRTQAEMCRIAAKATKEFHKAQRHAEVPIGLVDVSLANEVCPADDGGNVSRTVLAPGPIASPRKTELSATAVSLINQIIYLASTATSRAALLNGIMNVEMQAAILPPAEAGAVIGIAAITRSSLDYWDVNLDAWVSLPATKAVAYTLTANDLTAATVVSTAAPLVGPRFTPRWWQNPFVQGFGKVLAADGMSAARTIYVAWELGPIGWDAAAASALFSSSVTAVSLIF